MADGRVVIEVVFDDGRIARGVANIDSRLGGIGRSAKSGIAFVGKLAASLGLVGLAHKGINLVKNSLDQAFQRIDAMEQFESTMTALTGSSEQAGRALKRTTDIVTGTGYRLDTAAKSVQDFVLRGMEVDKATKYVEAWGDAVAFYGDGSNESLATVTDAIGKMLTKGKVSMDQMNRIFDAKINPIQMFAQATGKSTEEVEKALSSGKISAEEFFDTVNDAMMKGTNGVHKIAGAAKEAGDSWGNIWGNMRTHVASGVAEVIKSIDEMLKDNGLPTMRQMVKGFGETVRDAFIWVSKMIPIVVEKFQEWRKKMEPIIKKVEKAFKPFIETTIQSFMDLWDSIEPIWEDLKRLFESLTPVLMLIGGVLAVVIGIVYSIVNAILSALGPAINTVINLIEFWANLIMGVFSLIYGLFTGDFDVAIEYFKKAWESMVDYFKNLWKTIENLVGTFIESIVDFFVGLYDTLVGNSIIPDMVEAIIEWFENMKKFVTTIVNSIKKVIVAIWNGIKLTTTTIWNGIKSFFSSLWKTIKSIVTSSVNGVKTTITSIWNGIKSITSSVWNGIKTTIGNGIKGAWNTIKGFTSKFLDAGKGLLEALTKGIKQGLTKAVDAVKSGMKKVRSFLPFSPAKEGPLSDLDKSGESFFPTWADGMKKGEHSLLRSVESELEKVKDLFEVASLNIAAPVALPATVPTVEGNGDINIYIENFSGRDDDIQRLEQAMYRAQQRRERRMF